MTKPFSCCSNGQHWTKGILYLHDTLMERIQLKAITCAKKQHLFHMIGTLMTDQDKVGGAVGQPSAGRYPTSSATSKANDRPCDVNKQLVMLLNKRRSSGSSVSFTIRSGTHPARQDSIQQATNKGLCRRSVPSRKSSVYLSALGCAHSTRRIKLSYP